MSKTIIPKKLTKNSHIRVIVLSRSRKLLDQNTIDLAISQLSKVGYKISFGSNVDECDDFMSSSIKSRIDDLHDAFSDHSIDAILTVIGGYNSNQLLKYIDYDLIKNNPKILCGFSDVTAVANAITAKTGMITYTGPHFSSWAMLEGFEYSKNSFIETCHENKIFDLYPSENWSDDPWYLDQKNRAMIANEGYWIINEGQAIGKSIGGHLRCLNALQGTEYMPDLQDTILLCEEDAEINPELFDRQIQSIAHQKNFKEVRGILIGRFQKESKITKEILKKIFKKKPEFSKIPIIANVNFGHTTPISTLPIGGIIKIDSSLEKTKISILEH
jgi:muramoyltetrapeptide carboxypeptidase